LKASFLHITTAVGAPVKKTAYTLQFLLGVPLKAGHLHISVTIGGPLWKQITFKLQLLMGPLWKESTCTLQFL